MFCQRRSLLLQLLVAGILLAGRGGARLLQILKAPLSRTATPQPAASPTSPNNTSSLLQHCPELDGTYDLERQFAAMLDARDAAPLQDWLVLLTAARIPALARLAKAIPEDRSAVVYDITAPFNSGVNNGRITDLKFQKRIMAGRARGPLLRHRVILMVLLRCRYR